MKKTIVLSATDSRFTRLKNILIGHALDIIGGCSQQRIEVPRILDKMRLVEDMSTKNGIPFGSGLYQASNGKKYFIKMWSGQRKNADFYNLLHEASVLEVLNAIQKRIKSKTPLGFANIQVPNLISIHTQKNSAQILMEYYKSNKTKAHNSMSLNEKIEFSSRFVRMLGENASGEEKRVITTKSGYLYILQFPFISMKLIIKRPSMTGVVLLGSVVFCKGLFAILRGTTDVLVHGDLQENNMIYSEGKMILTDFEQTIFTFADIENITMASSAWIDNESRNNIVNNYLKNTKNHSLWNALAIYSMFFSLTGNVSKDSIRAYKAIIAIAIKNSFSVKIFGKKNFFSIKINI